MVALIKNINTWKTCVILVAWKSPPYKPIPVSNIVRYKVVMAKYDDNVKIIITILLYRIDLSLLDVIAQDNNSKIIDKLIIKSTQIRTENM